MKLVQTTILLIVFSLLLCSGESFAGSGDPIVYKVTMKKFEASQDGTTWYTVTEQQQEMDLASVNAGQVFGNWISGAALPEGIYTQARVTLSNSITIKGYVLSGGTYYYTITSGQNTTATFNENSPPGDYDEYRFTITSMPPGGDTLDLTAGTITSTHAGEHIEILKGKNLTLLISFDVAGGIQLVGGTTLAPNTITSYVEPQ